MPVPAGRHQGSALPPQSLAWRFTAVFVLDAVLAAVALWIALLLRFEGAIDPVYWSLFPGHVLLLVLCRVVAGLALRLHRWSYRLSGLQDGLRIALAGVLGTGLFLLAISLLSVLGPPRSVVVLELLLSTAGMAAVRFGPRLAWTYWAEMARARRRDARRTVIVGAGAAGEMLSRDLRRSAGHNYRVVGFVDDNPVKWGTIVGGRRVFGGLAALPDIISRQRIDTILIAIPRFSPEKLRDVLSRCSGLKVQIKILPISFVDVRDRGSVGRLQNVSPEDLLPRELVSFADHERSAIAGRRVLVTGAAGSIGSEICRQLLDAGVKELVAIDINENRLYFLEQRLRRSHPQARVIAELADVRDAGRVDAIFRRFRPQDVFHAAAHKQVPLVETAPCEAIKNNVAGTSHVIRAAERYAVACFVFISSDKAVAPTSVMGATKRIGEMMTRDLAARTTVRCRAVRFGNVVGSDGSVVPVFKEQIAKGGPVTVTHPDMKRYFMSIDEAVGLVLRAAYGDYGDLCVLDMGEPIRILDLARQMITLAGFVPDVDMPITITGLRPGEKLSEELVADDETIISKDDSKIQVVSSPPPPTDLWERVAALQAAAAAEDATEVLHVLRGIALSGPRPVTAPSRRLA